MGVEYGFYRPLSSAGKLDKSFVQQIHGHRGFSNTKVGFDSTKPKFLFHLLDKDSTLTKDSLAATQRDGVQERVFHQMSYNRQATGIEEQ